MINLKRILAGAALMLAATSAQSAVILTLDAQDNYIASGDTLELTVTASTTGTSVFTSFGLDLLLDGMQLSASDFSVLLGPDFMPRPSLDGDGLAGDLPLPFPPVPPSPFAISGTDILLATISVPNLNLGDYVFSLGFTQVEPDEGFFNADFLSGAPGPVMIEFTGTESLNVSVNAPLTAGIFALAGGVLLLRRRA